MNIEAALRADNEIYKKIIRENGWKIIDKKAKCTCTPTKYYHIPKKMEKFAPNKDEGCYKCPICGRPQFCKHCVANYDMSIQYIGEKTLKKFNQTK